MLLYHDTLQIDKLKSEPLSNTLGFFAGREMCYTHSIGDPNCERNKTYYNNLKNTYEKFGENTYIFEYYADHVLFSKMLISLPGTISQDMKDFKAAGITKISSLSFLRYTNRAYPVNTYVYAKSAWDSRLDYKLLVKEYSFIL